MKINEDIAIRGTSNLYQPMLDVMLPCLLQELIICGSGENLLVWLMKINEDIAIRGTSKPLPANARRGTFDIYSTSQQLDYGSSFSNKPSFTPRTL